MSRQSARLAVAAIAALLQVHLLKMASPLLEGDLPTWIQMAWYHIQDPAKFHWSGYQSRMLGVGLIVAAGGDLRAYMEVTWFALTLAGLFAWRLGGASGLGILHACFAVWASPWFAPWDMFEPAIFIAFVVLVVEGWDWRWLVGLFALAIFNLQTAMWIPLWMVLSRRMVLAGIVCLLGGFVVMYLLQHSGSPKFGLAAFQCLDRWSTGYSTDYAQERVPENLRKLFTQGGLNLLLWAARGTIAMIALACWRVRGAMGLTFATLLGATVVFGIVDEMRVYLPFIPLLIVAAGGEDG